MSKPVLTFHYAVASNGVIGCRGKMPWQLPSDLANFKKNTINKPVIMGRKTFQSIGRPLPKRTNIILTASPTFTANGTVLISSISKALDVAYDIANKTRTTEIAIIGGAIIFNELWDQVSKLYVTHVHAQPEGDTFMPPIDQSKFQLIQSGNKFQTDRDSHPVSFAIYDRITK